MKKILLSLVIITAVVAETVGMTVSYFTSTAMARDNAISMGTVVLNPDPNTPGNFLPLSMTNMAPGDGLNNEDKYYYRVNLRNDGTLSLKYRVRFVVAQDQNNDLYNSLRLKMGEYSSGPSKVLGTDLTMADLEKGIVIDTNVKPTALDTRVRTVWFRFYLPSQTGNEVQGDSVGFNIIFDAVNTGYSGWPL